MGLPKRKSWDQRIQKELTRVRALKGLLPYIEEIYAEFPKPRWKQYYKDMFMILQAKFSFLPEDKTG